MIKRYWWHRELEESYNKIKENSNNNNNNESNNNKIISKERERNRLKWDLHILLTVSTSWNTHGPRKNERNVEEWRRGEWED